MIEYCTCCEYNSIDPLSHDGLDEFRLNYIRVLGRQGFPGSTDPYVYVGLTCIHQLNTLFWG